MKLVTRKEKLIDAMDEFQLISSSLSRKVFATEVRGVRYDYYLTEEIGDPSEYLDLCNILRTAGPQDEVVIRFNSGGGQVRTGNQIINAIEDSQAHVVGFIEHDCGSMATFIFLACHSWAVSRYAEWFSHTVSGGNYGKEPETFEASQFLRRVTHRRIREDYAGFLTAAEIEAVIGGKDIYLDADEIVERLEAFAEARAPQEEEEHTYELQAA